MNARTALLKLVILLATASAIGALVGLAHPLQQKGTGDTPSKKDGIIELNKHELGTTVTITSVGTDLSTPKEQYSASRAEDKKVILVSITNTLAEPIWVLVGDPNVHYRPRLLKDGQLMPYKEGLVGILRAKDRNGPGPGRIVSTVIQPNEKLPVDFIDLAHWYEPLEPGKYQLNIKYRFRSKGRPIETNTVTFEVVP